MDGKSNQFKVTAVYLKNGMPLNENFEIYYSGSHLPKFEKYFPRFTEAEIYCKQVRTQNPDIGFCISTAAGASVCIPPRSKFAF